MSKNSAKAWPIAIISSILACVAASVATIIISLDYPVEMDSAYISNYKAVDAKINDILANQKEFEAKYAVKFISDDKISIKPRQDLNEPLSIKCAALLTRPETNAYNADLPCSIGDEGIISLKIPSHFEKPGRWQILLRLSDDKISGFFRREFFVQK
ncbi:4-hydroxy-3-methylbut-2-en-1-yl diphosphate synthase [Campylobacter sp. 19-13652]|uniref:4-hydroxy-3-methylbut-2-en-1-yl diphosphate synthase n=1 Tax=Campylobacter sp. 19-13652 TaxID=2840180 RepID=UPI001C74EE40|nr:4-hydroxy-3-methylbut-2-en-1-yl diphosphate synthase [Campylobacter sp. 19-13652]BCX80090.1 hypothetical protein LBC_15520 [Campylobacter sp. 19-13652]